MVKLRGQKRSKHNPVPCPSHRKHGPRALEPDMLLRRHVFSRRGKPRREASASEATTVYSPSFPSSSATILTNLCFDNFERGLTITYPVFRNQNRGWLPSTFSTSSSSFLQTLAKSSTETLFTASFCGTRLPSFLETLTSKYTGHKIKPSRLIKPVPV